MENSSFVLFLVLPQIYLGVQHIRCLILVYCVKTLLRLCGLYVAQFFTQLNTRCLSMSALELR